MNRQIAAFPDTKGLPPLDIPLAGAAIETRLREERGLRDAEHEANRSKTPARLKASDAHGCERKVAFSTLRVPRDIEYTAQQLMTFQAGDWYHQVTQEALTRSLNARCEVEFDWRPQHDLYGRCDAVTDDAAVEIKSQSSYGFELSVGNKWSEGGPGPKVEHLIQAGLAALSPQIDKPNVLIVYINKDQGTTAEWLIGIDERLRHVPGPVVASNYDGEGEVAIRGPSPTIRELVDNELARLATVLHQIDDGTLPARLIPDFGLVKDPPAAGERRDPWPCRYCSWQPTCASLASSPLRGWVQEHVEATR